MLPLIAWHNTLAQTPWGLGLLTHCGAAVGCTIKRYSSQLLKWLSFMIILHSQLLANLIKYAVFSPNIGFP